jgi:hypothetical protein
MEQITKPKDKLILVAQKIIQEEKELNKNGKKNLSETEVKKKYKFK